MALVVMDKLSLSGVTKKNNVIKKPAIKIITGYLASEKLSY
jgi:hypothetical protein